MENELFAESKCLHLGVMQLFPVWDFHGLFQCTELSWSLPCDASDYRIEYVCINVSEINESHIQRHHFRIHPRDSMVIQCSGIQNSRAVGMQASIASHTYHHPMIVFNQRVWNEGKSWFNGESSFHPVHAGFCSFLFLMMRIKQSFKSITVFVL